MKRSSGFTLLEMLIVIAMMGILLVIALPALKLLIDRQRLRDAVAEVDELYRQTRLDAVRTASGSTFNFNPSASGTSWTATGTDASGTLTTLSSSRFACVVTCSASTSVSLIANRGIPQSASSVSISLTSAACAQGKSYVGYYSQACGGSSSAMTQLCAQNPGAISITIWPTGQSSVDKSQCPGA